MKLLFVFSVILICAGGFFQQGKMVTQNPCASSDQREQFDCFLDSLSQHSDLDKINAIRKYLASRVDAGSFTGTVSSPFDALQGFADNTLAAQCGLASHILTGLLQYAGYTAYIYHCGFENDFAGTHKFVLADLNGKLIVQDAFYNATFKQDFLTMLDLMKAGRYDDIKCSDELTVNEVWFNKTQLDSVQSTYGSGFGRIVGIDTINGRVRMLLEHDYASFTQTQLNFIGGLFSAENLPVHYFSLYRKPIAIYDDKGIRNDSILNVVRSHL